MEQRYFLPEAERYFSSKVDFESYFNDYGKLVADSFPDGDLMDALGLPKDKAAELKYMELCTDNLFPPKTPSEDGLPFLDGFTYDVAIPESVNNLKSVQIVRERTKSQMKDLRRKLNYPGQVDLDDNIMDNKFSMENIVDLAPCAFYVFHVRVYIPVSHSKYTQSVRARDLQVSQEFLCVSSTGLDSLRDRIACSNDFQPADGDISLEPSRKTQIRTGDLHKSAMFYFGNDFFVDARQPDNLDYSFPLTEWGKRSGLEFGSVFKMEQSTMADLKGIRLGYPYVYIHQGTCEHLVFISDARLLHPADCLDSTKYPIMIAFSSLTSRYCFACHVKMAKYLVVDSNRLPEDAVFMCTACLESFNYKGGQKIGQFKVYAYVDRAALL
uniref:snRNA-activating protein complex subunit 3 n=1 Tax=Lygus hesperus TaxID=30085 RepID=A0A0A9YAH2_LYGHE